MALWTGDVHAAVCMANRRSELRAATTRTVGDVRQASEEIGANLFVVPDSPRASEVLIKIATLGTVTCPTGLKKLLANSKST